MRFVTSLVALFLLVLLAGCNDISSTATRPSNSSAGATVGGFAPELEGTDIKGNPFKLSDFKGKVVVVDFWATWCAPCKAMIPHERKLVKQLEGRPFVLVGVSADHKPEHLVDFLAQNDLPWPNIYDGFGGPRTWEWNIKYFPTFYIIDVKGVIRSKLEGANQDLERPVLNLLAEAEADAKAK